MVTKHRILNCSDQQSAPTESEQRSVESARQLFSRALDGVMRGNLEWMDNWVRYLFFAIDPLPLQDSLFGKFRTAILRSFKELLLPIAPHPTSQRAEWARDQALDIVDQSFNRWSESGNVSKLEEKFRFPTGQGKTILNDRLKGFVDESYHKAILDDGIRELTSKLDKEAGRQQAPAYTYSPYYRSVRLLDQNFYANADSAAPTVTIQSETREERSARRQKVVKPILTQKGWSRSQLATAAGVGKDTVYQYWDGTRVTMTPENRKAIAEELGLNPEQLPE